MTNEELVAEIQAGHNEKDNLGQLWEQVQLFIRKQVQPFTGKGDIDDLMQESYFAMVDAVNGFDASLGNTFLTYLSWKVRQKAMRHIQNTANTKRISVHMQERINKYKALIASLGYVPTDDEAMEKLNLTKYQYDFMVMTMYEMETVSIDATVQGDDNDMCIGDIIGDGTDFASDLADESALSEIWSCVDALEDDRRKSIILNRYKNNVAVADIATELNVSQQYIRQLEHKALEQLAKMDRVQMLAQQFDYDCFLAYKNPEKLAMKHLEYEESKSKAMEKFENIMELIQ